MIFPRLRPEAIVEVGPVQLILIFRGEIVSQTHSHFVLMTQMSPLHISTRYKQRFVELRMMIMMMMMMGLKAVGWQRMNERNNNHLPLSSVSQLLHPDSPY